MLRTQRDGGESTEGGSGVALCCRGSLRGGARLGVSNDVDSTAMIPAAYRQAQLAFDVSSVGRRVVSFGEIPLQQLLLNFAREEFSRVLPAWADAFEAADVRSGGRLSVTLRAYAENNMNLLEAARQLGVHANTVYARFERIHELSGRDARHFDALNELLLVSACRGQGVSTGQG